jgi:hypothetical protein
VDRWFATENFNRVSGQQLANNIRTMPTRVSAVRADGINVWDLSLQRSFSLNERWKLQFRAQAEGAMNHPNFAVPNAVPTNFPRSSLASPPPRWGRRSGGSSWG